MARWRGKTEGVPALIDEADGRLRVVVFTRGPLRPVNRVFFERLAADPLVDLRAIVVDEYTSRDISLALRLRRGSLTAGRRWLAFKIKSRLGALLRAVLLVIFEALHPRSGPDEGYGSLGVRTGTPLHGVSDINSDQCLPLIRSLRPQLGVIVGDRMLRDAVTSIPEYGTLNLHKRRLPDYPDGGPVAYWEVLAGEPTIGISIHYVTSERKPGPILAEATIPIEECDTLESLQIKADILGATLYHDAVRRVAVGDREGKPHDAPGQPTQCLPSELQVHQLQARLRRRAVATMPTMRSRPSWPAKMRVLVQYAVLLPLLLHLRHRFAKHSRVPICIFFYHVVANRPVNRMCLPLEEFVSQIEFLRRHYEVVSLEEAVRRVRSGRNERLAVAITFDDGYRDNLWAIEYLRYFGIPASFFISVGHVCDGSPFEHDRRAGFMDAPPMRETEVRGLASHDFLVGSHGVHHEDFGRLDAAASEPVLQESRRRIGQITGRVPEHFAFPIGQRKRNMTRASFEQAQKYYRYVYSAYGGYNFPRRGRTHFLRVGHPMDLLELAMIMDGYTGFRDVLSGNGWGLRTDLLSPY